MAFDVGERVGDYEIVGLIGAGGMGRVYKVRSIISNREEAMKVLLPDLSSEHELAERFIVEIRTLAGLEHPNIAQLRTAFQFQNQLIMIMEFVEGATLEKLASASVLPVDRVLDYAAQTLSALSFAHSHGVIHRDIKPANIMITTHGQVKLMDFGIAKNADEMHLTRPGMTIGSVYYMSPEQVRGGTVDARSDLYSLGVTLYESLTGRKPFRADTSFSVLNAHLNEAPVPPIEVNAGLSPELNSIVLRALAKNPDDRFQTAQEFHDALKALGKPMAARVAAEPALQPPAFMPVSTFADAPSATSAIAGGFTPVFKAPPPQAQPAAAAPPPFVPVSAPGPAAPPAAKSHRGLWIGMGALAAILALAAVAWVLPHLYSTLAKQKAASQEAANPSAASPAPNQGASKQQGAPTPDGAQPANSASDTNAPGSPSPSGASGPAEGQGKAGNLEQQGKSVPEAHGTGSGSQHRPSYSEPTTPGGNHAHSAPAGSGGAGAPAVPATASVPTGPSPQEVREAHDRLMNIEARADAARAGVQSIRSQQQAQGLDIRGDILAAMSRMNNDLREAQTALRQNDLQTANQYLDRADQETAKLESFLGR
jgi:serine/threonine-protein kinase